MDSGAQVWLFLVISIIHRNGARGPFIVIRTKPQVHLRSSGNKRLSFGHASATATRGCDASSKATLRKLDTPQNRLAVRARGH